MFAKSDFLGKYISKMDWMTITPGENYATFHLHSCSALLNVCKQIFETFYNNLMRIKKKKPMSQVKCKINITWVYSMNIMARCKRKNDWKRNVSTYFSAKRRRKLVDVCMREQCLRYRMKSRARKRSFIS